MINQPLVIPKRKKKREKEKKRERKRGIKLRESTHRLRQGKIKVIFTTLWQYIWKVRRNGWFPYKNINYQNWKPLETENLNRLINIKLLIPSVKLHRVLIEEWWSMPPKQLSGSGNLDVAWYISLSCKQIVFPVTLGNVKTTNLRIPGKANSCSFVREILLKWIVKEMQR